MTEVEALVHIIELLEIGRYIVIIKWETFVQITTIPHQQRKGSVSDVLGQSVGH